MNLTYALRSEIIRPEGGASDYGLKAFIKGQQNTRTYYGSDSEECWAAAEKLIHLAKTARRADNTHARVQIVVGGHLIQTYWSEVKDTDVLRTGKKS